jgi:hypothetical protein
MCYTEFCGASGHRFSPFWKRQNVTFGSYFHASYFESILKIHVGYIIFHGLITNNQDVASDAEWSIVSSNRPSNHAGKR